MKSHPDPSARAVLVLAAPLAQLIPVPRTPAPRTPAPRTPVTLAMVTIMLITLTLITLAGCERSSSSSSTPSPSSAAGPAGNAAAGGTPGGLPSAVVPRPATAGVPRPLPDPDPQLAGLDAFRLRNVARVQYDRDDREQGYPAAARALETRLAADASHAVDWLNLARALYFAGDAGRAVAASEAARLRLVRNQVLEELDYIEALARKSVAEQTGGDFATALALLERVTASHPDLLEPWYQRGVVEEKSRAHAAAERSYRRSLEIDRDHRGSLYRLPFVLMQLGRRDETGEILARFQALPENKSDNEQCRLTVFTRLTPDRAAVEPPRATLAWTVDPGLFAAFGGGATAIPSWSKVGGARVLVVGPQGASVWHADRTIVRLLDEPARGGVWADLDNDELDDVVVETALGLVLMRATPEGYVRLHELRDHYAPVALDLDHDGDLDLAVVSGPDSQPGSLGVLRNDGALGFAAEAPFGEVRVAHGLPRAIDFHDLDQANDVDVVVATLDGPRALLNLRHGKFQSEALAALGPRTILLVEDLDGDGAPDVFAAGGQPGWTFGSNADQHGAPYSFRVEALATTGVPRYGSIFDAVLADLDLDGDLDVALATEQGFAWLRNQRGGQLEEEAAVPLATGLPHRVEVEDLDGDGIGEVLISTSGGIVVLRPGASPAYAAWRVVPEGRRDNRNGVGAVVEESAGRRTQTRMVKRPGGLLLGTGEATRAPIDGLRLRWPQLLVQSEPGSGLEIGADGVAVVIQRDGAFSSCPFLYAEGPDGWTFVTDVLGLSPLDEWRPPGKAQPPIDAEEFVRIPGDRLAVRDGRVRLAITEELRETAYLDALCLVAVEHPAGWRMFADESTAQGGYDSLTLRAAPVAAIVPLAGARVRGGPTLDAEVAHADGVFAHGYTRPRTQWEGYVLPYTLELEPPGGAAALLCTGRVAWYDSTVAFARHQHGGTWRMPRLEVLDASGAPVAPAREIPLPAGMDRTYPIDLPALPAGARLAITAEHRLLWDQFQIARTLAHVELPRHAEHEVRALPDGSELSARWLAPLAAELGYHGYSRTVGDQPLHEQQYLYSEAGPEELFLLAAGRATRHGPVTELVGAHDDHVVVLVTGDRVVVEFAVPEPPPVGRAMTYFLRVSGWSKEACFHNTTGGRIEPLPFRAMGRYPPPAGSAPDDPAYAEYLETYQTRVVGTP